jgi:hypothetical protein
MSAGADESAGIGFTSDCGGGSRVLGDPDCEIKAAGATGAGGLFAGEE